DFYTSGRFNPLAPVRLSKWAKENNISIIHSHGFKADIVGLLAAKLSGCKAVTTPHGWSLERDWKLMIYEGLDKRAFRFMDMVCPLSSELLRQLTLKREKTRLILNGVDVEEIDSLKASDRRDTGSFLVGYVGRLIESKDISTLLAAVKDLIERQVNLRLMIIGDGILSDSLKTEAQELHIGSQVEFLGFRDDAISLLKTLDVFVLPSLSEGIPRCVMEAMACGIPVVASDIPGNRDLVRHGETGLIFKPGDHKGLSEMILSLIISSNAAREMAVRARKVVEADFSGSRMASEYTDLYEEILST
ncbi:MAG: glycosyltransferase family 4 protein, partial [Nitrospirales bacterium]|nr:glycosyltransferase family 4 protein [Nitrospirales bacterium]